MHKSVFAAMLFTLAACATATTPEEKAERLAADLFENDPRRGEEVSRICFASRIDGFRQTTDRAVVVTEGTKDYLVTTRTRCSNLDGAMGLGVDAFSSCLTRGDKLIGTDSVFGDNFGGPPSIPCYVDKMYEWDRKAEAPAETDDKDEDTEDAAE